MTTSADFRRTADVLRFLASTYEINAERAGGEVAERVWTDLESGLSALAAYADAAAVVEEERAGLRLQFAMPIVLAAMPA